MVSVNRNSSSPSHDADPRKRRKKPRVRKPLDKSGLRDLALAYAARFATTGAKLERYLARKIRERGVAEDEAKDATRRTGELDVTGLVNRLIELGYVDDDAYARTKSRDLTQRGYGKRRVEQALWAAGVEEETRAAHAPNVLESRRAAVLLARKRGFGPLGHRIDPEAEMQVQRAVKEKQIAAMLRAGHDFEAVRFIVDAAAQEDIEAWLEEAEAEYGPEESGSW